jgi:hypothetical protein
MIVLKDEIPFIDFKLILNLKGKEKMVIKKYIKTIILDIDKQGHDELLNIVLNRNY